MGILEIRNLNLSFNGKKILDDLNFDLLEGNIYSIVGPNGAGKSTLAFAIMGIKEYKNITGDILFKGESIIDLDIYERAGKGITLAWQEPARFEGISIRDFLSVAARDKSVKNIRDALFKVLLDPDEYMARAVDKTLSGGERKKIEIASILLMEPKLVLLDEPDSGIDIEALARIFDIIQLLKSAGATVVLITHSLAVLKQSEHAFLMCHGKLVDKGSVGKISSYFENKCMSCGHKNIPE